jgi:hypothetical protein
LYVQAFDAAPDDYYTGINAAAKSVFLGTPDDLAKGAFVWLFVHERRRARSTIARCQLGRWNPSPGVFGIPALSIFLLIGMAVGREGPGGVRFSS